MSEPLPVPNSNRRRKSRIETAGIQATLDSRPASVIDLTLDGIGMVVSDELEEGEYYDLELCTDAGTLCTKVAVVWVHPAYPDASWEYLSLYRLGARFPPMSEAASDLLRRICKWQSARSLRPDSDADGAEQHWVSPRPELDD